MLYLAYGSNLLPARLQARTPSAEVVRTVRLDGWRLSFAKRSHDGSGKCTIEPDPEHVVHGAVYRLSEADEPVLDRIEGVGRGYEKVRRPLDGLGEVSLYLAEAHAYDPSLEPYHWYLDFVVAGARWHGFPPAYVERLLRVRARPDPDRARAAQNAAILGAA